MALREVKPEFEAARVVNHIADVEQEIDRLEHLRGWLDDQANEVQRELDRRRSQLAAFIDMTHEPEPTP